MNTLTKALAGVSISLLTTLSFAAETGKEASTYNVDAGKAGSGKGEGTGNWGITSFGGTGQKDIAIYDTNTQKTTLTNTKSEISVHLHYEAATNVWTGALSVLSCKNIKENSNLDGCKFVKLIKPIELYDIKVNLDEKNLGTVSYKDNFKVLGTTVVTTASYKFS